MGGDITTFLDRARTTTALVVGDLMVDAYLWGQVERISPEAPVPVVQVKQRSARLGGAANVALNLKALGAVPVVVSVIGNDEGANTLQQLFVEQGLNTIGLLRADNRRTTIKTRVISGHQHIVRVDEEQEDPLEQADELRLIERVRQLLRSEKPQVLVFEDYDKGVLTARTVEGIIAAAKEAGVPVAVDPKKRNFLTYLGVNLFKPNLKELREGLKTEVNAAELGSVRAAVQQLEQVLGNAASLVTLSEHGVYAHSAGEEHLIAAHRRIIADVSGAGDTVIAVAALALAQGMPLAHIAQLANLAGGLVCEVVGVAPIDPERFRSECQRLQLPQ